MKINMVINSQPQIVEANPDERFSVVLRKMSLFSVKCGCNQGICGSCTVLLDGKAVPSCIIPVAAVRGSEIITLEYFQNTDEGKDIITALTETGVILCGFCNSAKVFAIHELLEFNPRPSHEVSYKLASAFSCSCTDSESLVEVINKAASLRRNRMRGIQHGKK